MPKFIDLTGKNFGNWQVINPSLNFSKDRGWNCLCSCGNLKIVAGNSLRRGISKSCGCVSKEQVAIDGKTMSGKKTRTYNSWDNMIGRCTRPSHPDYHRYGGRGIFVCQEWLDSFKKFREDMGDRPEGLTLERVDVNGNYTKGNCRWATNLEQQNNKGNSVRVPYNGELITIKELSIRTNIKEGILWGRKQRGVPLEKLSEKR